MKTNPSEGVTPIKLQSEKSTKQRAHLGQLWYIFRLCFLLLYNNFLAIDDDDARERG